VEGLNRAIRGIDILDHQKVFRFRASAVCEIPSLAEVPVALPLYSEVRLDNSGIGLDLLG